MAQRSAMGRNSQKSAVETASFRPTASRFTVRGWTPPIGVAVSHTGLRQRNPGTGSVRPFTVFPGPLCPLAWNNGFERNLGVLLHRKGSMAERTMPAFAAGTQKSALKRDYFPAPERPKALRFLGMKSSFPLIWRVTQSPTVANSQLLPTTGPSGTRIGAFFHGA